MSTFGSVFELSWLTGSDGFQINGEAVDDYSGRSVASAGDVNGDGFADLIIGANGADPNGSRSGASYVVFGSDSGFDATFDLADLDGSNGFQMNGEAAADNAGRSVASAGDINGDGFDDLIIGASWAYSNGPLSGATYVVFGTGSAFDATLELSDLDGTNGFQINGDTDVYSGSSVASAGDVNGDGFGDLIIGAYGADPNGSNSGAAYVVFGTDSAFDATFDLSDLDGTNGFQINGEAAGDKVGMSVASAGDVNGDGIDDLIIGVMNSDANGVNSGATYVVFGSESAFDANFELSVLDGSNGFQINGEAAGDFFGRSVASAGDVNGDGVDDLIIGAFYADPNGTSSGASYVVFGTASGFDSTLELSELDGTNGFQINGEAEGDLSGFSVASAGDVNGDGFDDVIIGVWGGDPNGNFSGASYVVFGTDSGFDATLNLSSLNGTNGFQINGKAAMDISGFSVAAAGDVNGDGYDDLIVAAYGADPNGSSSGASYIIFGKATQATTGDDELTGAGGAETISGLGGDDTLLGMAGHDQLFGGAGNDSLAGGAGTDSLDGGAHNDSLVGAAGGDTLIGATGNDSLDGGAGDDSITGGSGSDSIIASVGNDTMDGGAGGDMLSGGNGSDSLIGGAGNDTIIGGAARDILAGGQDDDVFKFTAMTDMTLSEATSDVMTDFKRGQDKIDMSTIDASTVLTTDDAFIFRGSKEFKDNNAGEINFRKFDNRGTNNDYTLVYIDTDTDKASEGVIKVMGLHNFTAADFIL